MKIPSVEEVQAYASSKGYETFDAEHFWAHHESKGWIIGRGPMRSWRAAVVTWHKLEPLYGNGNGNPKRPCAWTLTPLEQFVGVDLELLKKLREAEK